MDKGNTETKARKRPTTLKDVAEALGMHKSTVSLALSGKGTIALDTRQRVLKIAREMGYEPNLLAQRLANGMGATAVCIFSGLLDVGLATEKILLVQKALGAHGLEVPIYTCYDPTGKNAEGQAAQIRQVCRQRPRAIICAAQRVHPAVFAELAEYQAAGGIVVSYDTPIPLECDQVVFDREDNAYQAVRYLLKKGHRKIGFAVSQAPQPGEPPQQNRETGGAGGTAGEEEGELPHANYPLSHRLRGVVRALSEYDLAFRPDWHFRNATYEKGGAAMARQFLAMGDRPTAIAVVNDYVALALMVEVMRVGVRVPEDLSLIGHDNQPISEYCPVPLTSMTQPTEKIADAVVDLLLARLNGETPLDAPPKTVIVRGELVERNSVSPNLIP